MSRRIVAALACTFVGTVLAVVCLAETTAITMTAFSFLGIPAYGLGAALYLAEVLGELRSRRVL